MNKYLNHILTRPELGSIVAALSIDKVFGVFTRQAFENIVFPQVKDLIVAVIFADINNLHHLNEAFGYATMDERIKRAIKSRREDIVLRWYSGDEIVWVILGGNEELLISRVQKAFKEEGMGATFASRRVAGFNKWSGFENIIKDMFNEIVAKKALNKGSKSR